MAISHAMFGVDVKVWYMRADCRTLGSGSTKDTRLKQMNMSGA
jgi:hypothetical protein